MFRSTGREAGFTLLEIVIVLTIIGFLLAMIAPRLGTIGTSSVKTIDESNVKSLRGYVMLYQQDKARLPNKPITVVNSKGKDSYQLPLTDDGDTKNGPESIGWEFMERCNLQLHILSEEEADELKRTGIRKVAVLNDYLGSTNSEYIKDYDEDSELEPQTFSSGDEGRPFYIRDAEEGLGVLMVGAHATSDTGRIKVVVEEGDDLGNPEWIYRIVVGVGRDCSLVTDGMMQNEGLSPRGMQNKDFNTYNNYCMILPRFKSTLNRIGKGEPREIEVTDVRYDKDDEKAEQKICDLGRPQEMWEVDVCSPLGYKWPQDTVSMWKITDIKENF